MSEAAGRKTFFKARRTGAAVTCVRCGQEFTKTTVGKGRCRPCVEAEAAEYRSTHCASCGQDVKEDEDGECVYGRPFHLGTFDMNPQSDFWDNWTDGSPNTDRCKALYGKEGGYIWSGCGCTMGPEKEDECEVHAKSHSPWPENHPLMCVECEAKGFYCQRDAEHYQLDSQGFFDAMGEMEGDEGEEGDEGDGLAYEGDEGSTGYDGEEDLEDELGPDEEPGLSPDEDQPSPSAAKQAGLGGSMESVQAVWVVNKGGNVRFQEEDPANTLPEILREAQKSEGAPNSVFVEKIISVPKLQKWRTLQGYMELPVPVCSQLGMSLRLLARRPDVVHARTPVNVVATHLTSETVDQLNNSVYGRVLLVRYDSNGVPVNLPRNELIRVLFFVNDIFQMLFDSLAPSPALWSAWKQCFLFYDHSQGDCLYQDEVKAKDGRYMNGTTGERNKMELVSYMSQLREREGKRKNEESVSLSAHIARMTIDEVKRTEENDKNDDDATNDNNNDDTDDANSVKIHTEASEPVPSTTIPTTTPSSSSPSSSSSASSSPSSSSSSSSSPSAEEKKSAFPFKGARCVIQGLKKTPALNGRTGELVGQKGNRWSVQLLKDDGSMSEEVHDLLPANFTQDSTTSSSIPSSIPSSSSSTPAAIYAVELAPAGVSTPSAAIPLTVSFLPPSESGTQLETEKAYLKSTRGWKDPQALEGYSVRGSFRDLCCFYDAADETSPLNELANRTFCAYKKVAIRGSVIICHASPPLVMVFGQSPAVGPAAKPELDLAELRETLLFYTANDARKVAKQRDSQK